MDGNRIRPPEKWHNGIQSQLFGSPTQTPNSNGNLEERADFFAIVLVI